MSVSTVVQLAGLLWVAVPLIILVGSVLRRACRTAGRVPREEAEPAARAARTTAQVAEDLALQEVPIAARAHCPRRRWAR